jgi:hypothetical protein
MMMLKNISDRCNGFINDLANNPSVEIYTADVKGIKVDTQNTPSWTLKLMFAATLAASAVATPNANAQDAFSNPAGNAAGQYVRQQYAPQYHHGNHDSLDKSYRVYPNADNTAFGMAANAVTGFPAEVMRQRDMRLAAEKRAAQDEADKELSAQQLRYQQNPNIGSQQIRPNSSVAPQQANSNMAALAHSAQGIQSVTPPNPSDVARVLGDRDPHGKPSQQDMALLNAQLKSNADGLQKLQAANAKLLNATAPMSTTAAQHGYNYLDDDNYKKLPQIAKDLFEKDRVAYEKDHHDIEGSKYSPENPRVDFRVWLGYKMDHYRKNANQPQLTQSNNAPRY